MSRFPTLHVETVVDILEEGKKPFSNAFMHVFTDMEENFVYGQRH